MYITEREIMAQHEALSKTYGLFKSRTAEIAGFFENAPKKFVMIGIGSSYMLAKGLARLLTAKMGVPTFVVAGGDYLMNPEFFDKAVSGSVVIALSRSGATSEIVQSVCEMQKRHNVPLISVTMKEGNELEKLSILSLLLPWAFDESVCQTRSVTNLYTAALLLYAVGFCDSALLKSVEDAIIANEAYKNQYRPALEAVTKKDFDNVVVLADGPLCGIAEEGALAFSEICMIPGSFYSLLDYRHGPIVLNNRKTLTIVALHNQKSDYQDAMLHDVKNKGGVLITMGSEASDSGIADCHISLPDDVPAESAGLYLVYICQMIALSKALNTGVNPDAPAGLDPFITL